MFAFLVFHIWTILYKSLNKSVRSTACWTQTCSCPKRVRPQEGKTWTELFGNFVLAKLLWYIGMSGNYSNLLLILKIKVLIFSGTISSIEQWKLILLMHFSRNVSSILANLFSYDYCFMKQDTRINSASNKEEKQLHMLATCIAWW